MALNSTVSEIINRAITNFNNIRSALITMHVDVSSMDSDDYANAIINNVVNNQTLTITPTTEEQTINVPSGYTGFGTITVNSTGVVWSTESPVSTDYDEGTYWLKYSLSGTNKVIDNEFILLSGVWTQLV